MGGRNSPVSYNRILSGAAVLGWPRSVARSTSRRPDCQPDRNGTHARSVRHLSEGVPAYGAVRQDLRPLDIEAVGEAIASFERVLVTGPTPYDYGERLRPFESMDADDIKNDPELSAAYEKAERRQGPSDVGKCEAGPRCCFFSEKANCTACHAGANFTDEKYHNMGVGMDKEMPIDVDHGREDFTKDPRICGAFKTPTIRNVAASGPYMHDGSQTTLEEVVEWYAKGGHPNPNSSEKIKKLDLSDQDKKDSGRVHEARSDRRLPAGQWRAFAGVSRRCVGDDGDLFRVRRVGRRAAAGREQRL